MQIAMNILEKKDLPQDMQKNIGLRKWAMELLQHYSPVKLDDRTKDKLVNGEVEIPTTREINDFLGPKGLSIDEAKAPLMRFRVVKP